MSDLTTTEPKTIYRQAPNKGYQVFSDLIIDWGVAGMREHCADIALFEDVTIPPGSSIGTYRIAARDGRPLLLVEVGSTVGDRRKIDVKDKFEDYARIGAELYLILDQEKEDGPRFLRGYRLEAGECVLLIEDERGRIELGSLGLQVGLVEGDLVCYDAVTGKEIGYYSAVKQEALEAPRQANEEAQARQQAEERIRVLEDQLRQLHHGSKNGGAAAS